MTAQTQIIQVQDKEHFHELRSKGVGASDVAPILGLSNYRTAVDVWMEKTGKKEPFEGNELTRAGSKIEKVVAEYFEEESGHRIIKKTTDDYLVVHPVHEFMRCHPDREYFHKDFKGRGALECKTGYYKDIVKGELPLDWFCQNQYQLGILGYKQGSIAWLTFHFGPSFDFEEFEFSSSYFEMMQNEVGNFWINHVLKDIPPPAVNSEDTLKLFPEHFTGKKLIATPELFNEYNELVRIKSKIKALEADLEHLSEPIKMAMEDAESVWYESKSIITWKKSKDSEMVDSEKLKKEFPEIYSQVTKVRQGGRRFLLK